MRILAIFLFSAVGLLQGSVSFGQETVLTTGKLVDQNGKPIANRKVYARELNSKMERHIAVSDAEGEFEIERNQIPTLFFVLAPQGSPNSEFAGITKSKAAAKTVTIEVLPLISLTGQYCSKDGKPMPETDLVYMVQYKLSGNGATSMHFEECRTDEEGWFEFKRVIVGGSADICLVKERDERLKMATSWQTITHLEMMERSSFDIGKISIKPKPKPLTSEGRAAAWLAADFHNQLKRQKVCSRFSPQNVLVIAAPENDPLLAEFIRRLYKDEQRILKDYWSYRVIVVNSKQREAAFEQLGIEDDNKDFSLHVLSKGGKTLASAGAEQLTKDGLLDCVKVAELLGAHTTERLDGRKMLDEALAKANTERKKVILTQTSRGKPCDQLLEFFSDNRQWEKDFVWVPIDHRWTDSAGIIKDLRGGFSGTVPWIAIFDENGETLTTSVISGTLENHNELNIGYPTNTSQKSHFKRMLRQTRKRMTDAEVDSLIEKLKDH